MTKLRHYRDSAQVKRIQTSELLSQDEIHESTLLMLSNTQREYENEIIHELKQTVQELEWVIQKQNKQIEELTN